jgi:hypothetical protein
MKPQAIKVNSHATLGEGGMMELGDYNSGESAEEDSFDGSEIFNDVLGGGGVEPSIDDTLRDSIRCSFVSSDGEECDSTGGTNKDGHVMNRMNWITLLKVLFDELESFQHA